MRDARRQAPILALAALTLAVMALRPAVGTRAEGDNRVVLPGLAADSAASATRTYRMGWFAVGPQPTAEAIVATIEAMSQAGDAVLIQREVPWDRLLAGQSMEMAFQQEYDEIIAFVRARGLRLSILVDPLNGLDRTQEGPLIAAARRSLMEPAMLAMHETWVTLLAERYKPDYLGLASEINTLAELGSLPLYEQIRGMVNRLAPEIRRRSPATKVFVSVQVDEAWGRIPLQPVRPIDHFALGKQFDIDVLGLSSYPSFVFADPAEIPADYYRRFREATGKPLIQVEGGWASAGQSADGRFTPEKQAAYLRKLFELLDSVEAELLILLTYADLDLSHPSWGPGIDVGPGLGAFASMGLADTALRPKASLSVWLERFQKSPK